MQETISQLAAFIAKDILKQPGRIIKADEALLTGGLVDSLTMMDLVLFIENTFNVRMEDTELNADTFDTLEQLAKIIEERKA